jgi:hypothetical protein
VLWLLRTNYRILVRGGVMPLLVADRSAEPGMPERGGGESAKIGGRNHSGLHANEERLRAVIGLAERHKEALPGIEDGMRKTAEFGPAGSLPDRASIQQT